MIRRFVRYYKPHMRLFTADLLCALVLSFCDLVYPMITREMIKDYIPNRVVNMLLLCAAALLGIYLLKMCLNYFIQYYGHLVGVRMQADMRRDVFDHLQKLPFSYFDNHKTGTIMSRITNDLMDITELAHHGPEDLFISLIMLVGSFVLMCGIYVPLALIVVSMVPFMVFFAAKKRRRMSDAFAASRVEMGEINANLENSISGIRVSKAYTNRAYENDNFAAGNNRFVHARTGAYKVMAEFSSGTTLIGDLLNVVLYLSGGLFVYYGKIDVADFAAFLLYISVFMNPIRRLIGFVEQFQNGMTGFKRFVEIMDAPVEQDSPDAVAVGNLRGEIDFRDVDFAYDGGKAVLSGLSFTVEAGKTLALVGPSGGGKTTICHLIPRFYEVDGGSLSIDGMDIREMSRLSLRQNIGIVAQDVFMFNASIYDNIAYGCPGATREQVEEAAKRANIHDYILTMPEGYDTIVGERGMKLSGGQKQRLSIARIFLKNPPILILDEATSALDSVTEAKIQRAFDTLAKGRTTLIIAHRLSTIRNANRIVSIADGIITECGNHQELLEKGGIYADLYTTQTSLQ